MGKKRYSFNEKAIDNSSKSNYCNNNNYDSSKYLALKGYKKLFILLCAFMIIILFRCFVIDRVSVSGISMEDTFFHGDMLWLKKYSTDPIERNDIVVVYKDNKKLIKRVIALPNEEIQISEKIYINNILIEDNFSFEDDKIVNYVLSENEYFVLGDNRDNSLDSRHYGAVNIKDIRGKVFFQIFPFTRFGYVGGEK